MKVWLVFESDPGMDSTDISGVHDTEAGAEAAAALRRGGDRDRHTWVEPYDVQTSGAGDEVLESWLVGRTISAVQAKRGDEDDVLGLQMRLDDGSLLSIDPGYGAGEEEAEILIWELVFPRLPRRHRGGS